MPIIIFKQKKRDGRKGLKKERRREGVMFIEHVAKKDK